MTKAPLIVQPLIRFVDFRGRSRRAEYWLWVLVQVVIYALVAVAASYLLVSLPDGETDVGHVMAPAMEAGGLFDLIWLILLIPSTAVTVRRLHDSNRTGWWAALPMATFLIGAMLFATFYAQNFTTVRPTAAGMPGFLGESLLLIYLPPLIAALIVFVFTLIDGTPGPNRFGADPKGRGDVSVF